MSTRVTTLMALLAAAALLSSGCDKKSSSGSVLQIDEPSADSNPYMSDSDKMPPMDSSEPYRSAEPSGYMSDAPAAASHPSGTAVSGPQPVGTSSTSSAVADPQIPGSSVIDSGPIHTGGTVHVAAKGDTYWSLAKQYYGDGKQWRRIAEANPAIPADKIKIGSRILIPQ